MKMEHKSPKIKRIIPAHVLGVCGRREVIHPFANKTTFARLNLKV